MRWKWPLFGEKPYCVRRPGDLIAPGVVSCHSAGRARSAWPPFDSRGAQVPAHSELRQGCGKVRQGAVRSLCLLLGPADLLGRQISDTGARPRSPRVPRAQVSRPRSTRARGRVWRLREAGGRSAWAVQVYSGLWMLGPVYQSTWASGRVAGLLGWPQQRGASLELRPAVGGSTAGPAAARGDTDRAGRARAASVGRHSAMELGAAARCRCGTCR